MIRLTKYLKPFTLLILAAIVLLFIQAMATLALPDYMSHIVNQGIQQGGIESAVPEKIRETQLDRLFLLMEPADRDLVRSHYELLDTDPVYQLKDTGESTIKQLNPIMGRAFLVLSGVDRMQIDITALSEGQLTLMINRLNERYVAVDDSMLIQTAAGLIRAEYEALGMDTKKIQNDYIIHTGLKMLLITLISAVSIVLVGFLASRIAAGFSRLLRKAIFTKIEGFSMAELDRFSTASLITRTTNDITQIQMLVLIMIRMFFYAPIMGVGGVIRALGKSTSMSWIIALAVIVLLGLVSTVFVIALPKFKAIQRLIDRLNLVIRENLSGMMVIRAFNTQRFEEERFDQANIDLTRTNLFVNRIMVSMFPAMMLLMNGITLLIVWVGAQQIAGSSMQVGDMMAFMQYVMQIIFAFLMMSMMFIMIPRASVAANRVAEVLETRPEINDPEEPEGFNQDLKGVVEFNDVSFRFPGAEEDMLKNISFKALPGQTTAFIGSTGCGKSTLINLIPRFYDVTSGQVLVDGIDVRRVRQHDLREKIGYMPQKSSLFSGTIESNLKYAVKDATDEEIKKAAEIAQAVEFISEKTDAFQSHIAQGGANVSGGQKQRLSIARALVKKPEVYIFDDSFSSLDFRTSAALRKALNEYTGESTILIVDQRISTIMNAEQIIVLEEGKIVGSGRHRDLMENCATYQEIALSQLSKEELA
jgi:ATP-binding cassette, subfamily B, multidrug efflux pump